MDTGTVIQLFIAVSSIGGIAIMLMQSRVSQARDAGATGARLRNLELQNQDQERKLDSLIQAVARLEGHQERAECID